METGFEQHTDGELLAVIDAALNALNDDRLRLPTDTEQLSLLLTSLRVGGRLQAWQQRLAARIDTDEVAWREHRTSTTTWLAEAGNLTPREARRLVRSGQDLRRFATVAAAATDGTILPGQAEAISGVLTALPPDFPADTIRQGEDLMVGFAATHNSAELRRLSGHLLEALAPDTAEELDAQRVERQYRAAVRSRHLDLHPDGQGSVLIRGSLPSAHAEPLVTLLDAYAAAARRDLAAIDPQAEHLSPAMRRADALVALVNHHQQLGIAPVRGGDRPRVVVTFSYDTLLQQAREAARDSSGAAQPAAAAFVRSGEPVPAALLRQWLCDADLLPVVLGGPSEILDVGPAQRLPRAPHHPVVGGRHHRADEPRPPLPSPPRHRRTRPRPHRRPLEGPPAPRRGDRDPAAATSRPQPATPAPRPVPHPALIDQLAETVACRLLACGDGDPLHP
jgi:hypothetical protein